MTIDEQIKILESNSEFERKEGDLQGCLNFRQLAEWLKDYKRLLGAIDAINTEIEELAKHPAFGDLSVGVSCGAVRCLEIVNKHTSGGDANENKDNRKV